MNIKLIEGLQKLINHVRPSYYYNFSATDTCILGTYIADNIDENLDWYYDQDEGIEILKNLFGIDIQDIYDSNPKNQGMYERNPMFIHADHYFTDEENLVMDLIRESYTDNQDILGSKWLADAAIVMDKLKGK